MYTIKVINNETGRSERVFKSGKAYAVFYSTEPGDKDSTTFDASINLAEQHLTSILASVVGLVREGLNLDPKRLKKALADACDLISKKDITICSRDENGKEERISDQVVISGIPDDAPQELKDRVERLQRAANAVARKGIDVNALMKTISEKR